MNGGLPEGSPAEGETDGYVLGFNGRSLLVTPNPADGSYVFAMPETEVAVSAVRKAHPWTGSGTAADPYVITTTEGLDLLATLVNVGNDFSNTYFRLGADIAYPTTTAWDSDAPYVSNYTPIGISITNGEYRQFSGTFDGAGHTVSGIRIFRNSQCEPDELLGFFVFLNGNSTVSNITLTNTRITAVYSTGTWVHSIGGIAGMSDGTTISNCHVKEDVVFHSFYNDYYYGSGGILGCVNNTDSGYDVTISHCTSAAKFTVSDEIQNSGTYIGGITGGGATLLSHNLVVGTTLGTTGKGAISFEKSGTFDHNYYGDCIANGTATTSGIGTKDGDVTAKDGAVPATILYDNGTKADDNAAAIAAVSSTANVALYGRTLYKDGTWNTLCLPFGVSNFTGTPLEGATVMELDATETYDTDKKTGFDAATGTLHLYFKTATAIEAGRPYIVKWTKPDGYDLAPYEHDIYSPVFAGVTVSAADPTEVSFSGGKFVGSYAPVALTTSDDLLIGSGNTLHQPAAAGAQLNAFRAYLKIPVSIGLEQLTDIVLGKAEATDDYDVNGDKQFNILDITTLIDYLTGHGLVQQVVSNVELGLGD